MTNAFFTNMGLYVASAGIAYSIALFCKAFVMVFWKR